MARMRASRSNLGQIVLYPDDEYPVGLRVTGKIKLDYLPVEGGEASLSIAEWTYQNGPVGAGITVETPESYQGGGSELGEFVWLRRLGVVQPAGRLRKLTLPSGIAATTIGYFAKGKVYGVANDVYVTTNAYYVLKIPGGTGLTALSEVYFGNPSRTAGIAVFNGVGAGNGYLYVGDSQNGIWEYNGSAWTEGAAGTERGWLEVPYWAIAGQAATGGSSGSAGTGAHRLVGTDNQFTGIYHVSGDPKVEANWSAFQRVGPGGTMFPILDTVATNREVAFGTGQGIYALDNLGYSPNATQWVEHVASQNTGRVVAYWNGMVWFATEQGAFAFSPDGDRQDIGISVQFGAQSGETEVYGRPRCVAPCEDGLYWGYYNEETQTSYVGCLLLNDENNYRWSMAEAVIEDEEVTFVKQVVGSDGMPRLLIGTINATHHMSMYMQDLPKSGDPETDYHMGTAYRAAENWNIRLSRFSGGRAIPMTIRRLMMTASQLGEDFPGNQVEFQLSIDGDAFAVQGVAAESRWSSSARQAYVRAESSIQVKLTVTNAPDQPVVIQDVGIRYSKHPELTEVKRYPVTLAENIGKHDKDPNLRLRRLVLAQSLGPIPIQNEFGRRIEGKVEPTLKGDIVMNAKGNGYMFEGVVMISTTRRAARFDVGDIFDGGEVFG